MKEGRKEGRKENKGEGEGEGRKEGRKVKVKIDTHICIRLSFDDVTRINFQFRLLVTWSSPHGRGASSHKIWCKGKGKGQDKGEDKDLPNGSL